MKTLYTSLVLSLFTISIYAQNGENIKPKLSPLTKKYLQELKKDPQHGAGLKGYNYKRHNDGKIYASAIIKVANPTQVQPQLETMGAFIGTKAGDIWTVQVPIEKVIEFTEVTGISYLQIDEAAFPQLDQARKTTRVDSVHQGVGLPTPFSGKNVVVGVIDFGFDYTHPTFYDTLHANYRVRKSWELNSTGTPPASYSYGHELADSNSIRAQGTDNAQQNHGTSVAGVAAGSGYGSTPKSDRFRGMAYDADLVFVGVRRDSLEEQWMQGGFSDFIDGINYIFTYAGSVGKPAVVNISWGSQAGPHDGTSLMNQACDNLTGVGKIVVMSAGNDGSNKIHINKTFGATDSLLNTFLDFSPATYKRTWVDTWGDTGKTFCSKVTLFRNGIAGNTTGFVCIDDSIHSMYILGANGTDTCYVDFITSSAEFNMKPRVTVSIFNKAIDSINVTFKATSGAIDAWDESYYYGFPHKYQSEFSAHGFGWATPGNLSTTVSEMGAAKSVLLVGAYASKVIYTDINSIGRSYAGYVSLGSLVPFSSRGPMIDGRIKPDIAAPGLTLATSMSSYDTTFTPTGINSNRTIKKISGLQHPVTGRDYYYAEFIGTSASSPAASGIVALMLQANPTLSQYDVQTIIAASAIKDVKTGPLLIKSNTWGSGKINAYGAVKLAIQNIGVYDFTGKKIDCVVYPNPNNGTFTLDYSGDKSETLNVEVINLVGCEVSHHFWNVIPGVNREQLDLSTLPKGIYNVRVSSAEGMVNIKVITQ